MGISITDTNSLEDAGLILFVEIRKRGGHPALWRPGLARLAGRQSKQF
jgi:hypothetical protein